jgi:hypothetical protein
MKKILLLLVAAMAFSGLLSAAPITVPCDVFRVLGPINQGTNFSEVTISCPQYSAGGTLVSAVLTGKSDYSAATTDATSVSFSIAPIAAANLALTSGSLTPTVSGGVSSSGFATTVLTATSLVGYAGAGSIQVVKESGSMTLGQISGAGSVGTEWSITYSDVPEPTTIAFMGGGFLALGIFARRRKRA